MNCINCNAENEPAAHKCQQCGFGLSCLPAPAKRDPSYLGDSAEETADEKLARTFVCPACKSCGGNVRQVATTGAGISRIFDIQNKDFVAITCQFCKAVQLYDSPGAGRWALWKWLDYYLAILVMLSFIISILIILFG